MGQMFQAIGKRITFLHVHFHAVCNYVNVCSGHSLIKATMQCATAIVTIPTVTSRTNMAHFSFFLSSAVCISRGKRKKFSEGLNDNKHSDHG